jgi:type II secretory pathway component PulF
MRIASAAAWAAALTLVHALLLLSWAAAMILYVPRRGRFFTNHDMTLPWLAQLVLDLSHWMVDYWMVVFPVVLLLLAADLVALFLCLRGTNARWLGWAWSALAALALLGIWVVSVVGLWLPLAKLEEGLSR